MNRKAVIKINTMIYYDYAQTEKISAEHQGKYYEKESFYYLNYQEQDADTGETITTTIRWQNALPLQVVVLRQGAANAKNVFQEGLLDCSAYQTAEGDINIETATERVEIYSDKLGGRLLAAYSLKMNSHSIGDYELVISYSFGD
jgi:uncharacterized beta-barrel protein YwiB (DUF1934 family)